MINKLFKNRYFLLAMQWLTLIVFILLIYGSIGIYTEDADFAKILRNTNLANLIVWSYWWPMIIATAILFGRYWCSICPMELITSLFGKMGLRRKPGKFLKSGWVITLFYAMILILGIHTWTIHRIPQYMAMYMLVLFAAAVLVGLIWEKRTFCTYVCPIGHLLGLYSLLTSNKLGVKDKSVCASCKTKDCIRSSNHYKIIGRSCTSELYPPEVPDNRNCILCGQCFKSCTHDNVTIKKRRFAADLFANIKLSWAEIGFFMIVSGFVVYEILSEWKVTKEILMSLPNWVNETLAISGSAKGSVKALVLFIVLPSLFYLIFVLAKKIIANESWKSGFTQLVLTLLPITASMHLVKALLKTTSRIPYWKYVFADPEGVETAHKIMENPGLLHNDFLSNTLNPIISVLALLIPILGLILSLFVIKKQTTTSTSSKLISLIAVVLYSSLFILTILKWKFL